MKIDFLLIARSQTRSRLLTDERNHGDVIHLGIIKAVEQMDGAGAGGRVAKPYFAGEFRMRRGHERGHLLVADLHIFHAVLGFFQRDVEASDAVARIPVDPPQAPFG